MDGPPNNEPTRPAPTSRTIIARTPLTPISAARGAFTRNVAAAAATKSRTATSAVAFDSTRAGAGAIRRSSRPMMSGSGTARAVTASSFHTEPIIGVPLG